MPIDDRCSTAPMIHFAARFAPTASSCNPPTQLLMSSIAIHIGRADEDGLNGISRARPHGEIGGGSSAAAIPEQGLCNAPLLIFVGKPMRCAAWLI